MEFIATMTGYLVILAGSVFVIAMSAYWTVHRFVDAWGVREKFLKMKKERDEAWATIRTINEGPQEGE